MADIKPIDVKKLRDTTAAGMKDCKEALVEANGDFEEAQKILRKKGLAAAGKRSGRSTNEGAIFISNNNQKAAMIEMTCETHFVAQNDIFKKFGQEIVDLALAQSISDPTNETLQNKLKEAISLIKENMLLKKLTLIDSNENEYIVNYSHDGGSIGALVKLEANDKSVFETKEIQEFGFDTALHIAAFNPLYLDTDNVDKKYEDVQIEVFTTQAKNTGKPENIVQGIVKGKLNKHYKEICLMKQDFVKDDKKSVEQVLKEVSKSVNSEIKITGYAYMKVGQE